MIECKICNKLFLTKKGTCNHISRTHKLYKTDYYLKYISTDPMDGKCHRDGCNNKTKFINFSNGFHKYCSVKCSVNSNETKDKNKQTCLKKYGTEYSFQSKEIKEKSKQTCLNKYGCENPFQNKEIKEKIKQTNLERYNVEYPAQSDKVKEKAKQTCLDKYGVENPLQSEEIKEKHKHTCLCKYGVEYITQTEGFKEKSKQTCLKRHGVEHSMQSDKVKEKSKQTCLKLYGIESPMQSEEIKNKSKQTCLEKYGVENPFQNEEIRKKSRNTCLERYGVKYPLQSEKFKMIKFKNFFNSLFTSNRLQNKVIPNFTSNDYKGIEFKYSWICTKCNTIFEDHLNNGRVPRCLKCYPIFTGTSIGEQEIYNFVQQYFSDAENKNRTIISPMELDIYIPSRNFAIEFDGLFWHSELNGKDKNYHLNKTLECAKNNIRLIHIFEDEWIDKQEIVKSIILSKLNLITNKIHARKCKIKKIDNEDAKLFLNYNHIQGEINGEHLGLFYNDELVSLLTYGKPRFNKKYEFEILRFCNKLNTVVVGGLSRLISAIKNKSIITYIDKRYSNGNSYEKSGFIKLGESKPSYYYIKEHLPINRFSRLHFQKHKLSKILESFDPSLTEWQNMQLSGYDRIWDCGNYIFHKE